MSTHTPISASQSGSQPDSKHPESLLEGLDERQKAAATALSGPVRITAVAGAGKTRTITRRIAYACAKGVWSPSRTVAVTFSVKAAREMSERLAKLGATDVTCATIHSLALRQLSSIWRDMIDAPFPTLTPQPFDALKAAISAITSLPADRISRRECDDLYTELSWMKVSLIPADQYPKAAAADHRTPPDGLSADQVAAIADQFEREKASRSQIDFNDILLILCHLIQSNPEVAQRIQRQIGWLTVDEYQDISPLQHQMIRCWLGKNNSNICVVGDPAQTIYSFNGATSWFLLTFDREFAPLRADIRLGHDYRSTGPIVRYANRVLTASPISGDYLRLTTEKQIGPAVNQDSYGSDALEARGVVHQIQQLLASGVSADEIVVLSRINSQLRLIGTALDQLHIPYLTRQSANPVTNGGQNGEDHYSSTSVQSIAEQSFATSGTLPTRIERVTLSTIHAAKGLEWDTVFLIGASDGLIPFSSATTKEQMEEERRLFYVGVTRGRKKVTVSWARWQDESSNHARRRSRFLPLAR